MAWWLGGGVGMYVVLTIGVLVGGASLLALALSVGAWFYRPLRLFAKVVAVLVVLGCVTPLVVGAAASAYGRYTIDALLSSSDIEPAQREAIAQAGYAEARAPSLFGGGMTCLLLLPAALAAVIALAIPRPEPVEED